MPLTIFQQAHHAAGNAPDTNPLEIEFFPPAMRLDLSIFDNIALVSFSAEGRNFSTERELPAGVISSLDMPVRKMRIRNKTVASVARYDVTAYYSPLEIVGAPFVPNM